MKQYLFLLVAALALFSSCDESVLDQKIETTFSKTLVADVTDPGTKSTLYSFSVTDTLGLEENSELESYLDLIKDIALKSGSCTLAGIPVDETIEELTISVAKTNLSVTLTKLKDNNSKISLSISDADIAAASSLLKTEQMLIITVSGKTTSAPMILSVILDFDGTVTASPLK